jgi:hypothetical protein
MYTAIYSHTHTPSRHDIHTFTHAAARPQFSSRTPAEATARRRRCVPLCKWVLPWLGWQMASVRSLHVPPSSGCPRSSFLLAESKRRHKRHTRTHGAQFCHRPLPLNPPSVLACRTLSVLACRTLSVLACRTLSVLACRTLSVLACRTLSVLACRLRHAATVQPSAGAPTRLTHPVSSPHSPAATSPQALAGLIERHHPFLFTPPTHPASPSLHTLPIPLPHPSPTGAGRADRAAGTIPSCSHRLLTLPLPPFIPYPSLCRTLPHRRWPG